MAEIALISHLLSFTLTVLPVGRNDCVPKWEDFAHVSLISPPPSCMNERMTRFSVWLTDWLTMEYLFPSIRIYCFYCVEERRYNAAHFLSEEPNVRFNNGFKMQWLYSGWEWTPGNSLNMWLSNTKCSCLVKCWKGGWSLYSWVTVAGLWAAKKCKFLLVQQLEIMCVDVFALF